MKTVKVAFNDGSSILINCKQFMIIRNVETREVIGLELIKTNEERSEVALSNVKFVVEVKL